MAPGDGLQRFEPGRLRGSTPSNHVASDAKRVSHHQLEYVASVVEQRLPA